LTQYRISAQNGYVFGHTRDAVHKWIKKFGARDHKWRKVISFTLWDISILVYPNCDINQNRFASEAISNIHWGPWSENVVHSSFHQ